jgi:hypothetical protein
MEITKSGMMVFCDEDDMLTYDEEQRKKSAATRLSQVESIKVVEEKNKSTWEIQISGKVLKIPHSKLSTPKAFINEYIRVFYKPIKMHQTEWKFFINGLSKRVCENANSVISRIE